MTRTAGWIVLLSGFLTPLWVSTTLAEPKSDAEMVDALFDHAAAHDVAGIKSLQSSAESSGSRTTRTAYSIALYLADPEHSAEQFVSHFPDDPDGIMRVVYEGIELPQTATGKRRTPTFLFSFDALGKLAMSGDRDAQSKLVKVAAHSDGVVTEFVCERVVSLMATDPNGSLVAIGKLDGKERNQVYACFSEAPEADTTRAKRALDSVPTSGDTVVVRDLKKAMQR